MQQLMAISPLDGRYFHKCQELSEFASEYGLIKNRVIVEIAWFKHLALTKDIPELAELAEEDNLFLDNIIENFNVEEAQKIKTIEATTNHDMKAVEYYLKQKFTDNDRLKPHLEFIHFACTSEDINNLAYALMQQDIIHKVLLPEIFNVQETLFEYSHKYANLAMLARTHGQAASPTTMGKEIGVFWARINNQVQQLRAFKPNGKINGAVGNFNAHSVAYPEVNWLNVSEEFIKKLELNWNPMTTQIEPHDNLAELCHICERINTIMTDLCRDMWSYISIGYFNQKPKDNEVGSSTMPHKINPIDFENAEGNLGMANALYNHFSDKLPISRWQRDLSDSTVMRNIGIAFGYNIVALKSLHAGLNKLDANSQLIADDLNNSWEVLGEAVQTVMRRHNIPEPYEKLKNFTRGKSLDKDMLQDFINDLNLESTVKKHLLELVPEKYTGLAQELLKFVSK